MKPARHDVDIDPRATNKIPFLLLDPQFIWRPIAAIQPTAPVRLTIPGHGLPGRWPVWFEQVDGFADLNRDKDRQPFRLADVVDADTIELNELNGMGLSAAGGVLVYRAPIDLTDCLAELHIRLAGQELVLSTVAGGLQVAGLGQLDAVITLEQSAALPLGRGEYDLYVTDSLGERLPWLGGAITVGRRDCHA
ncbi:hypothetical protein [Pseudomonas tohonis]|uniref:hypothetical protein n=1 Tax=Pseudomonas tohonis TaxID=2725477 RepID=UPI001F3BC8D4|nr:hypothetical protein [Pseudomonas tohonis]GJN49433.1 hypothetical protein TUM20249_54190 [Pseudomonas tohonis]